jgi:uncharacterized protein YkwD
LSHRTARSLTVLSVVLLIISALLIVQFGVPAIFAIEANKPANQAQQPAAQVVTPTAAPTETQAAVQTAPATSTEEATPASDAQAAAVVSLINDKRKAASSPLLRLDDRLSQAAQKASAVLARSQALAKDQIATTIRQAGYYYTSLWTSSVSARNADAKRLFDAWWRDPQGQQSLLGAEYSDAGLGSSKDDAGTTHYVLFVAAPVKLTAPGADVNNPGDPTQEGQAQAILSLLNAARAKAGLQPLKLNNKLTATALAHSRDQAKMDKMTHDGSDGSQVADRATRAGYTWSSVGENVLQRPDIHAAGAFDQWWNSPPHYENMMNPAFTEIGIAYAPSSTDQYYYTMVLGAPR